MTDKITSVIEFINEFDEIYKENNDLYIKLDEIEGENITKLEIDGKGYTTTKELEPEKINTEIEEINNELQTFVNHVISQPNSGISAKQKEKHAKESVRKYKAIKIKINKELYNNFISFQDFRKHIFLYYLYNNFEDEPNTYYITLDASNFENITNFFNLNNNYIVIQNIFNFNYRNSKSDVTTEITYYLESLEKEEYTGGGSDRDLKTTFKSLARETVFGLREKNLFQTLFGDLQNLQKDSNNETNYIKIKNLLKITKQKTLIQDKITELEDDEDDEDDDEDDDDGEVVITNTDDAIFMCIYMLELIFVKKNNQNMDAILYNLYIHYLEQILININETRIVKNIINKLNLLILENEKLFDFIQSNNDNIIKTFKFCLKVTPNIITIDNIHFLIKDENPLDIQNTVITEDSILYKIINKISLIENEKITKKENYYYCKRKNINITDYVFHDDILMIEIKNNLDEINCSDILKVQES